MDDGKTPAQMPDQSAVGGKMTIMMVVMIISGLLVGGGIGYVVGQKDTISKGSVLMDASTDGVTVGGAKMTRAKDMMDNIMSATNLTAFVTAVKAGGLLDTLKSPGPFTVFAPNNDNAFVGLPAGTLDNLLKPENKTQLANMLNYHVVSGTYTAASLKVMAQKGETLKTVQGETLGLVLQDNVLKVRDAKGGMADIETPDAIASNGVIHVITAVLMP